ncbi:hypothetical protein VTK26DRAFT_4530 [Humicola hyalothermophila]
MVLSCLPIHYTTKDPAETLTAFSHRAAGCKNRTGRCWMPSFAKFPTFRLKPLNGPLVGCLARGSQGEGVDFCGLLLAKDSLTPRRVRRAVPVAVEVQDQGRRDRAKRTSDRRWHLLAMSTKLYPVFSTGSEVAVASRTLQRKNFQVAVQCFCPALPLVSSTEPRAWPDVTKNLDSSGE